MPGRSSVLQRYYRITRWATLPMLLGVGLLAGSWWDAVATPYLMLLLFGGPATMLVAHYALVAVLMQGESRRWEHRLHIGRSSITVFFPTGEVTTWYTADLRQLRVIYTGHEAALGWHRATFNSNLNEVSFRHGGKEHRLFFRLVSPGHHRDFREWVSRWQQAGIPVDVLDGTSGVPVKVR